MATKIDISRKDSTRFILSCNPLFASPSVLGQEYAVQKGRSETYVPKPCSSNLSDPCSKSERCAKNYKADQRSYRSILRCWPEIESMRTIKLFDMLTCVQPLSISRRLNVTGFKPRLQSSYMIMEDQIDTLTSGEFCAEQGPTLRWCPTK